MKLHSALNFCDCCCNTWALRLVDGYQALSELMACVCCLAASTGSLPVGASLPPVPPPALGQRPGSIGISSFSAGSIHGSRAAPSGGDTPELLQWRGGSLPGLRPAVRAAAELTGRTNVTTSLEIHQITIIKSVCRFNWEHRSSGKI